MSQHKLDHVKSNCCNAIIHFQTTSLGYSINVWCSKCNNYLFTGRIETLISLWLGNINSVIKNKGYLPKWYIELDKKIVDTIDILIQIHEQNPENDFYYEKI